MIVTTAPSRQLAIPLMEGVQPYRRSTGQLFGTASTSFHQEGRRGENTHGRSEVPTQVISQADSLSSSSQEPHSQAGNSGVLSGAHHFLVGQMNAVETQNIGTQGVGMLHVATQNIHNHTNSLEKMLPYVIPGAEFNSAARDPPPGCHPDTRTQIRADLQNRINGSARLIWTHGPAGVGKSAIMQTVAETITTCATLFFSRSSDPPRSDSKKVLTTLAYSLAVNNTEYRKYIEDRMSQDPAFLQKSLAEQFHRLFITPFIDNLVKPGRQRWVVLLDGLDECKNEEYVQCRIVELIGSSILRYDGATPFVWVIASRPEAHLMIALRKLKGRFQDRSDQFWEHGIPVDSDDAMQDIERYLHTEFTKIKEDNPDAFPNSTPTWPLDSDFLKVAKASSGLFVFASTLTKYISVDRPASRLRLIISLIDQSTFRPTSISQRPFSLLDMLYTQVMSDIPEDLLSIAKSLLGYYRLVSNGSISHKGFVQACNILGLYQDEAYDALRKLHSVLVCPSPRKAWVDGIEFFHASFPDFLFDYSRSQTYHVDLDQECTKIWRRCIRILEESSRDESTVSVTNRDSMGIRWVPDGNCRPDPLREVLLHSCQRPKDDMHLLVDAPEVINASQSIHPVLFYTYVDLLEQSMDWINNHAPRAVQAMVVSWVFPVNQLDTERLFRSLDARPWCWYAVPGAMRYVDVTVYVQGDDISRGAYVKGEIRWPTNVYSFDLGEVVDAVNTDAQQQCEVRVVGMEPWKLYAVVGPFDARFGFGGDAFYVLPYSEP